jgi:hypothetical protein
MCLARGVRVGAGFSGERLDQHTVAVAADHEARPGTPAAVAVVMPAGLDPLHGRAALVARRRGQLDEICSIHR